MSDSRFFRGYARVLMVGIMPAAPAEDEARVGPYVERALDWKVGVT